MNVDITIPAQSVTIPSQDVVVSIPAAQIVYQNSWLGQGYPGLSNLSIFSPSQPGLYRVTATIYGNPSGNAATIEITGTITNQGSETIGFDGNAGAGPPISQSSQSGTAVFTGFAGKPFVLSTSVSGQISQSTYDLYVTIEQLQ